MPLEHSSFSFSANRTSAEAIEAGSNFVVVDVATITWNHAWFDRVRSTVGYLYGQEKHQGIDRSDTYQTFDTKLSYAFSRRLRLGVQFRHDARESPEPGLDYRRNLTLLTLESTL